MAVSALKRWSRRWTIPAGLVLLLQPGIPAQQQRPAPPGTIRVRVALVPVDVIVTDDRGRPVLDLTRDDFLILENGKSQEIRHFELETLGEAAAPPPGRQPLLRKIPTAELSTQTRRTFLILMGRGRYQAASEDVDALIRFVRKDLLPQDLVALFAYNRATDFTTDHEKVAQVLERYKKHHEKIESVLDLRLGGLAAVYGSKRMPKSLQPDIDRIFDVEGGIASRHVPPGQVTDSGRIEQDTREVGATLQKMEAEDTMSAAGGQAASLIPAVDPFDRLEANLLTDLPFEEYVATSAMTLQDIQNLHAAIEYLRFMEGEKHLLFFSQDGLFLPRAEHDRSLAAQANDARVMIDTFQTGRVFADPQYSAAQASVGGPAGGLTGASLRTGVRSRMFALSSLRYASELTGGRASIHQDISKSLSAVNEATKAHYLLGYYPGAGKWDGSYRRITVRVKRSGLKVSYRHGYYAREEIRPFDREEFLSYSRMAAAAGYEEEIKDLPFSVATSPERDESGNPRLRVAVRVDAAPVRFQLSDGRHQGRLYFAVFALNEGMKPLGDTWQTMGMKLKEETYRQVLREGIPYSAQLPWDDAGGYIKVVVYDVGDDIVGSRLLRLK